MLSICTHLRLFVALLFRGLVLLLFGVLLVLFPFLVVGQNGPGQLVRHVHWLLGPARCAHRINRLRLDLVDRLWQAAARAQHKFLHVFEQVALEVLGRVRAVDNRTLRFGGPGGLCAQFRAEKLRHFGRVPVQ